MSRQNSFTKQELSPVSTKSAAAAEAATIRRLKREVKGLTLAMGTLKKNSKEWEFLNSKLEMASQELDAVLQDEQLFQSITSTGSNKTNLSIGNMSEDRCFEFLKEVIPTPPLTHAPVVSDKVRELEERLSHQVKYSFEWFEIKRQIDAETKKRGHTKVNVTPNTKFVRSSTTGSVATPKGDKLKKDSETKNGGNMTDNAIPNTKFVRSSTTGSIAIPKRDKLKKSAEFEILRSSIKDDENNQCLEDRLERVGKYSLEWFELKRIISRRNKSGKARTAKLGRNHSNDPAEENSPPKAVDAQKALQHQDSESDEHSSCSGSHSNGPDLKMQGVNDDHIRTSLSTSDLSSPPKARARSDSDIPSISDQTPRTNDDLDARYHKIKQDQKDNIQMLQNFLDRVPKYSREYYQTKKIIRLMQLNS